MWSFGLLFCIHINHFGVSRNLKKRKKNIENKKIERINKTKTRMGFKPSACLRL